MSDTRDNKNSPQKGQVQYDGPLPRYDPHMTGVAELQARIAALEAERDSLARRNLKYVRLIAQLRKSVAAEASGGEEMPHHEIMAALSTADRILRGKNARTARQDSEAEMTAIDDIAKERQRQIDEEGWSLEHDDSHRHELAAAGASYALWAAGRLECITRPDGHVVPRYWPWSPNWWKPKDQRRDLVRAGALIVAEIEAFDRWAARTKSWKVNSEAETVEDGE